MLFSLQYLSGCCSHTFWGNKVIAVLCVALKPTFYNVK